MKKDELAAMIVAQQSQIERLTGMVSQLTSTLEALAGKPDTMTVADLWQRYATTMAGKGWWKKTVSLMKAPLEHFGAKRIGDLRGTDWSHYRDNVRAKQTTAHGKPPAPTTMNLELHRFKAMANWGIAEELIKRNPWQGIRPLASGGRETIVEYDGVAEVVRVAPLIVRALVLIAGDSGLRIGECLSLQWTWIDWVRGRVRLPWAKTKTKKSRTAVLSDRALDALRMMPRHVSSPYIFANPASGVPYTQTRIWQLWRQAASEAGILAAPGDGRVHFHDLRHSAITQMVRNGIHPFVAMRNAGHRTASQSWKYTHTSDDDLDDLKTKLDAAILRGPRKGPKRIGDDGSEKPIGVEEKATK